MTSPTDTEAPRTPAETAQDTTEPRGARPPLAGIRVLDVSTVYAAPITAMLLGDFGADVVKIEHPKGDPARTHGWNREGHGLWWKVISRNKRTMTLNFGKPRGQELLRKLVADADVLVENFRPGVMEKWNVGPDQLFEVNPRLVMLRVTGFGQDGPYSQRRAFGTLAEAMSGFAHQTGQEDGPPTLPPFGLADGVAGIAGAFAVVTALYARDADGGGRGQVIDMSLLEPLLGILGPGPTVFDQLGIIAGRHGNRSPNNAPRNAYLTRDGRWVAISASATSVAERVMRLVGRPDIAEKPWFSSAGERSRRSELLDGAVSKWIAAREFDDVVKAFEEAGAALAPIYDIEQLMADPQVEYRDTITTVMSEDLGPIKMQNLMVRLMGTPGQIRWPGRRLGQDNEQLYQELLGIDADELAKLQAEGVA
jgi:crotonobetainyl-CoA:carnitine CoA-transferase CaiB-like acyl-CoA transferase